MGATIKDVAKLAGTSTATVSKVMNGSYSISQETADKVRKAMEELDYHPNLRAKNFARQSARTIIFVAELGKGTGFANPQMFEILCGLEEVLAQKDYTLVVRNIAAGDCAEFIRNAADTKQADGFVIHASVISQALDELLFTHEIPHIVIGNPNLTAISAGSISITGWRENWRRSICWSVDVSRWLLSEASRRTRSQRDVWTEF